MHGQAALLPMLEREGSILVNNYIISIFRLAVGDFFFFFFLGGGGGYSGSSLSPHTPPTPAPPPPTPLSAPLLGKSSFTCTLNNAESVVIMIAEGQTYSCQLI